MRRGLYPSLRKQTVKLMQEGWNPGMVVAVAPSQSEVTTSTPAERDTDEWGQWQKHPYFAQPLLLILADAMRLISRDHFP